MAALDYRTAGESHGRAVVVLIEGLPAGLAVDPVRINESLRRRQGGFGRGGRMKIERDAAEVLSGMRRGVTIASPMSLQIANRDWRIDETPPVHRPRPGHADFAGSMKWLTTDCRTTLERASARETAARVAAGAVARILLAEFGVEVVGFVVQIGEVRAKVSENASPADLCSARDGNEAYCPDGAAAIDMIAEIQRAKKAKDTLGGIVEVRVFGMPPGVGSCVSWQEKLDGRLLGAVGSIQAFKGVEIGLGFGCAERPGSRVHDEMDYDPSQRDRPNLGFVRRTNHAGGLEGGMTNGMPIVVRGVMKPISTLLRGLDSVNLETLQSERSDYERSDICAVPAASVVAEHVVAFEIARAFMEKFGGDTMREMRARYEYYLQTARSLGAAGINGPADDGP
jgi:chorismate synthase